MRDVKINRRNEKKKSSEVWKSFKPRELGMRNLNLPSYVLRFLLMIKCGFLLIKAVQYLKISCVLGDVSLHD